MTVVPGSRPSSGTGAAWSRRDVLRAGLLVPIAGSALLPAGPAAAAAAAAVPLQIRPRSEWAGSLAAKGRLEVERAGDVRYLLVHHTASSNAYRADQVVDQLRSFYRFHTGPEKGWPDIAYNFLVDRYGGVWEGRTGSLDGPVKGSATGGSQGFDQLACFIGDLADQPPTPAARAAMLTLLAHLADRYDVDTRPGAQVTFTSRGSNRWPAGKAVTTATIAGHRDMSLTTCPGDAAYVQVRQQFPAEVTALRSGAAPVAPTTTAPAAPTDPPPAATTEVTPPAAEQTGASPSDSAAASSPVAQPVAAAPVGSGGHDLAPWVAGGALLGAAATSTYAATRYRRS